MRLTFVTITFALAATAPGCKKSSDTTAPAPVGSKPVEAPAAPAAIPAAPAPQPITRDPFIVQGLAVDASMTAPDNMFYDREDPAGSVYSDHKTSITVGPNKAGAKVDVEDYKKTAAAGTKWLGQTVDRAGWVLVSEQGGKQAVTVYRSEVNAFCTASDLAADQVQTVVSACTTLHKTTDTENKKFDDALERASRDRGAK